MRIIMWKEGTLYIDAICTNTEVRDKGVGRIRGAGTLLMNAIELYALNPNNEFEGEPFDNIKLSALPYVIGYYRKLGYRHVHRCRSLERRADGVLVEPSARAEITELAESAAMQRKFPNNEVMDNALKIELAKEKKILGTLNEQIENLIANLNEYFRGMISFLQGCHWMIPDREESPYRSLPSIGKPVEKMQKLAS